MKKERTLSDRIQAAYASSEVEVVMATHAYLHAGSRAKEEWSTIWSKADDVSWAHAFGRMRGWEHVWQGSVGDYDIQTYSEYIKLIPVYPEVIGLDPRPLMVNSMHPLTTGCIEVAADGETARCSYLTPGLLYAILNATREREGMMLWERYGADFRKEDGQWKYLHDQVCPDVMSRLFDTENPAQTSYYRAKNPEKFPPHESSEPAILDDPGPLHNNISPLQPIQNTVPWPEPYETLDNNNTYTRWPQYDA